MESCAVSLRISTDFIMRAKSCSALTKYSLIYRASFFFFTHLYFSLSLLFSAPRVDGLTDLVAEHWQGNVASHQEFHSQRHKGWLVYRDLHKHIIDFQFIILGLGAQGLYNYWGSSITNADEQGVLPSLSVCLWPTCNLFAVWFYWVCSTSVWCNFPSWD